MSIDREVALKEEWNGLRQKISGLAKQVWQSYDFQEMTPQELESLAAQNAVFATPASKQKAAELIHLITEIALIERMYIDFTATHHHLEKILAAEIKQMRENYYQMLEHFNAAERQILEAVITKQAQQAQLTQLVDKINYAIIKIDVSLEKLYKARDALDNFIVLIKNKIEETTLLLNELRENVSKNITHIIVLLKSGKLIPENNNNYDRTKQLKLLLELQNQIDKGEVSFAEAGQKLQAIPSQCRRVVPNKKSKIDENRARGLDKAEAEKLIFLIGGAFSAGIQKQCELTSLQSMLSDATDQRKLVNETITTSIYAKDKLKNQVIDLSKKIGANKTATNDLAQPTNESSNKTNLPDLAQINEMTKASELLVQKALSFSQNLLQDVDQSLALKEKQLNEMSSPKINENQPANNGIRLSRRR